MSHPQGHPGTKALNSGAWGGAPEFAPEIDLRVGHRALPAGIGYVVCLYTQSILSHRAGPSESPEGRSQSEKVAEIFVRKFMEKIVARYRIYKRSLTPWMATGRTTQTESNHPPLKESIMFFGGSFESLGFRIGQNASGSFTRKDVPSKQP